MVELRQVVRDDLGKLFDLKVAPEQSNFVAPNAITLAQAAYEPGSEVYCIWDGDAIVGLMAVIDCRINDDLDDGDDPNSAYLWRLMVTEGHQAKGYGRAAMVYFRSWAEEKGLPLIVTSAVPENDVAIRLYKSFGMEPTGRVVDGEIELTCKL